MSSLIFLFLAVVVITMFPQIFTLVAIGWVVFTIFNVLRGPRQNRSNPYQQGNPYQRNDSNTQSQSQRPKGDVIDVEYTETEVKEDK